MRRMTVVANRKMHGSIPENKAFLDGLLAGTRDFDKIDIVTCLPHPYLFQMQAILNGTHIAWGGQDMSRYESGARTGSVSPCMLLEFGCRYVIIGHSERRLFGYENDHSAAERFEEAIKVGLIPIFCMGETLTEYEQGMTASVTIRQLSTVLEKVGTEGLAKGILAYEPAWAIGTGKAATAAHAQIILRFLREHIAIASRQVAENITILYGGSVNAENATDLFSMPDIDGGLIGTASLNTDEFIAICQAAHQAAPLQPSAPLT